jgi:hypothetical protein
LSRCSEINARSAASNLAKAERALQVKPNRKIVLSRYSHLAAEQKKTLASGLCRIWSGEDDAGGCFTRIEIDVSLKRADGICINDTEDKKRFALFFRTSKSSAMTRNL